MFVNKIALRSFRNHNRETFEFDPGINVITGPNADRDRHGALRRQSQLRGRQGHLYLQDRPFSGQLGAR